MRRRNIQKIVRLNFDEALDLADKSTKACLSEAGLFRVLLKGYEPKEKPDDRFYEVMRELTDISNSIHQLSAKADALNYIDASKLEEEMKRWHSFQFEVEQRFLQAEKSDIKWR